MVSHLLTISLSSPILKNKLVQACGKADGLHIKIHHVKLGEEKGGRDPQIKMLTVAERAYK